MIVDTLRHRQLYATMSPGLARALDYLTTVGTAGFAPRTVELDGRSVYAMYQSYDTEPDTGRSYEAHRRYIDVQYILEGTEVIRVTDREGLQVSDAYNQEKDYELLADSPGTDVVLQAGMFAILFPHDAHMPKLAAGPVAPVKKVVVKVAV